MARKPVHKWKSQLLIIDKVLIVLAIVALILFKPDIMVIAIYFGLIPYLFFTKRKSALKHLAVASVLAIIWMLIGKSQYGYNQEMLTLFGINLFSLFAWAVGLFTGYLLYSHWEHKLKNPNWWKRLVLFSGIYIPALIIVETIAYYWFDIQNLATATYAGLPLCNCLHAPPWMQVAYILMGPLFFIICESIGLENPHHKKK